MDFNGNRVGSLGNILDANLNVNGFSLDEIDTFSMVERATPAAPIDPAQVVYFTNAVDILCSIDSAGVVKEYETAAGNPNNIIIANDASCQVNCANGGAVTTICTSNAITTGTNSITFNNTATPYEMILGGVPRMRFTTALNSWLQPSTGTAVINCSSTSSTFRFNVATTMIMTASDISISRNGSLQIVINALYTELGSEGGVVKLRLADIGASFTGGDVSFAQNATVIGRVVTPEIRSITTATANLFSTGPASDIQMGQTGKICNIFGRLRSNGNNVGYGLFSAAVGNNSITNTTTETTLFSGVYGTTIIPIGDMPNGSNFNLKMWGLIVTPGVTFRIRVRAGAGGTTGPIIIDTGVISVGTGTWYVDANLCVIAQGAAGVGLTRGQIMYNATGASSVVILTNQTTIDTTVANTISVTGEWSALAGDIVRNGGRFVCTG